MIGGGVRPFVVNVMSVYMRPLCIMRYAKFYAVVMSLLDSAFHLICP